MTNNPTISRLQAYRQLTKVPAFHPTAVKLMGIATESDSALANFEAVFRSDPSLAADLLVRANSAEFGLRARVETIRHALTLLGMERVRSLASNIMFSRYVERMPAKYVALTWRHSIATAVISEIIGELLGIPGAYTAGLLHDLGRLGLILSVGPQYGELLQVQVQSLAESLEQERQLCGMNHCDAGALMASTWGFPEILLVSMVTHHAIGAPEPKHAAAVVPIACRIADWLGYPEVNLAEGMTEPMLTHSVLRSPKLEPRILVEQIERHTAQLALV